MDPVPAGFGNRLGRHLLVRRLLGSVGNNVDIKTGLTLIIVFRLVISGYVQTSKSDPLEEYGTIVKVDPTEHIIWQCRVLDNGDLGTCPCSISGFIPALSKWEMTSDGLMVICLSSGIQWIVMKEQKPPSSGVIQGDVDSGENSKKNNNLQRVSNIVNSLKNNFWSYLALLVLFLDWKFWQIRDSVIGFVVIMFLGLGILGIVESGLPTTPSSWFEFPVLVFLIAYSLMFLSLILTCTQRREWLSHFMAGAAYMSAALGILGIKVSPLSLGYVWVCIPIILVVLVLFVVAEYNRDEAN